MEAILKKLFLPYFTRSFEYIIHFWHSGTKKSDFKLPFRLNPIKLNPTASLLFISCYPGGIPLRANRIPHETFFLPFMSIHCKFFGAILALKGRFGFLAVGPFWFHTRAISALHVVYKANLLFWKMGLF